MELQHNNAATDAAGTEPVRKSHKQSRDEFRARLEELVKNGPVQTHVHTSLRALRAALSLLGNCPEREFKRGLNPQEALATRAALELIRVHLNSVERQVLRAELVHVEQRRQREEARAVWLREWEAE